MDTFNKLKFILFAKFRKKMEQNWNGNFLGKYFLLSNQLEKLPFFGLEKKPQINAQVVQTR